jgi:hypothetical protein
MKQQPPLSKLLYYFLKKTSHNEIPKKDNWRDKKVPGLPLTPFFYKKKSKKIVYCPIICLQNTFFGLLTADQEMLFGIWRKKNRPQTIHSLKFIQRSCFPLKTITTVDAMIVSYTSVNHTLGCAIQFIIMK